MTEAAVKTAMKKYLKEIGAYYYMPVPMGYGAKTIDFFVCYRGRFYAIETKKESVDKPTAYQADVLRQVGEAGGMCWVENSTGLEKTKEMLRHDVVLGRT